MVDVCLFIWSLEEQHHYFLLDELYKIDKKLPENCKGSKAGCGYQCPVFEMEIPVT